LIKFGWVVVILIEKQGRYSLKASGEFDKSYLTIPIKIVTICVCTIYVRV